MRTFGFSVSARDGASRRGTIGTSRGDIETPAFMPVGTAATVKAMHPQEVRGLGAEIVLGNVYHLMLRPGAERVAALGGLHRFMNWPHPILTDSGGFQVMSLAKLRKLDESGVTFQSHIDGSRHLLTPERSIEIQRLLGSDIQMQFDECIRLPAPDSEVERAMELSLRWAERSKAAFGAPRDQALFGIVQGGTLSALRRRSAETLVAIGFDGYALGGLAVGEPQEAMLATIEATVPFLPEDRPRYLMGVGTPSDLLESVARGIDMFDCVMPTRAGRHGLAYTRHGRLNLRNARHADDPRPVDPAASCAAARDYSRAYLHHLVKAGEILGMMLITAINLGASARNIRESLAFTAEDRGLNIMPLFHIHGLIAGILAPLSAGGQVSCAPGYSVSKFFGWMKEVEPTWFTGVPTMHQDILAKSKDNKEVVEANKLRFIRSCSSSLPPQVMKEVEETFKAPVLEAYGMTEAAHQMASNPLPPKPHYPGSVGVATGPEIAIADEEGEFLKAGEIGEIVIRGDNVMSGYENNEKANAEAFTKHGWFRTGDQGTLSAEGYLSLTGRIKEIIIRGGEKISPREVDEVLMDHPAVRQCVTFGMPHDRLGEDVAAAIVLRDGAAADETAIRDFAGEHLAKFKVPAKILFLDEIPKGATGKLQRIGLAAKLGLG